MTIEQSKIDWRLLSQERNRGLFEHFKGLIRLRKENQALYGENINFFYEDPEAKVLAYVRWNEEGSRVVVIANFSEQFLGGYRVPNFPESGTWHEWTGDYDLEVEAGELLLDLGGYEAKVLVWR